MGGGGGAMLNIPLAKKLDEREFKTSFGGKRSEEDPPTPPLIP